MKLWKFTFGPSIIMIYPCPLNIHKLCNTLFSNSLVWARPALSRKILSSWMARAKIARAILVLLLSAPEQRQARTRRGPKGFWTKQHQTPA